MTEQRENTYSTLSVSSIDGKTAKAVQVKVDNAQHWIPLSQIRGDVDKTDQATEIEVADWILEQKDLK